MAQRLRRGFGELATMVATGNRIHHPTDMRIAMNTKPRIYLMSMVAAATIATLSGPLAAEETYRVALSSGELDSVSELTFRQLVFATLTVSRDLKDHDKYHCTYDPSIGPHGLRPYEYNHRTI